MRHPFCISEAETKDSESASQNFYSLLFGQMSHRKLAAAILLVVEAVFFEQNTSSFLQTAFFPVHVPIGAFRN